MSNDSPDSPNDRIERVLWLLTAFRADNGKLGGWMEDEVLKIRQSNDVGEYLAELGATLGALLRIANNFLEGWANAAETDPETIIAITRRLIEMENGAAG